MINTMHSLPYTGAESENAPHVFSSRICTWGQRSMFYFIDDISEGTVYEEGLFPLDSALEIPLIIDSGLIYAPKSSGWFLIWPFSMTLDNVIKPRFTGIVQMQAKVPVIMARKMAKAPHNKPPTSKITPAETLPL